MIFEHKSVLLMETVDSLNVKPDGIYVDGTLGGGGHAYEVCRRLNNKGSFIGIDQETRRKGPPDRNRSGRGRDRGGNGTSSPI